MKAWTMPLVILLLVVCCWFDTSNSLPVQFIKSGTSEFGGDQKIKTNGRECFFSIENTIGVSGKSTETIFYRDRKLDKSAVCHFMYENGEHNNVIDIECTLESGEVVRSCVDLKIQDTIQDTNAHNGRKLLSINSRWTDLETSDAVASSAAIGGIAGFIIMVIVIAMCVKQKKVQDPITVVSISKIQSSMIRPEHNERKVSMKDVKEALAKCDGSSETLDEDVTETKRSSNNLSNHHLEQPRPSSQVSTSSQEHLHVNNKQPLKESKSIERRLPQPPPVVTTPDDDDDEGDNMYESVPKNDPGYSKLKDPKYSKIKKSGTDTGEAIDPNYARVNQEGEMGAVGGDELYSVVKGEASDTNAKVLDKDPYSKLKGEDNPRASTASDDLYTRVNDGEVPPPVPTKSPDLDSSPGSSHREVRAHSQSSTESVSGSTSRPLPQQPLPTVPPPQAAAAQSSTAGSNKKEPNYSQVTVRESIESIKLREGKNKDSDTSPYMTVPEDPAYYSVVKNPPPSTPSPPPLPSDNARPNGTVHAADVGLTVPQGGAGARPSSGSDLYESISGEIADDNQRVASGGPVYAQVKKKPKSDQEMEKSPEAVAAMYAQVKSKQNPQNEGAVPKVTNQGVQRSSKRSSRSSNDGDVGYARIKDLMDSTDPGYQAIDELKAEMDDQNALKRDDMIHISEHKVDKDFWQRKDPTYQKIHGQEEEEEEARSNDMWNGPD